MPHLGDNGGKMGTRTFLETEVVNEKRRMDLLAKMMKVMAMRGEWEVV